MIQYILQLPKSLAILAIRGYQKTLSPDHGLLKAMFPYGYCRHYPSCSQYTKQSIERFGAVKGILKGMYRIARCNPWVKPSIDIVPSQ